MWLHLSNLDGGRSPTPAHNLVTRPIQAQRHVEFSFRRGEPVVSDQKARTGGIGSLSKCIAYRWEPSSGLPVPSSWHWMYTASSGGSAPSPIRRPQRGQCSLFHSARRRRRIRSSSFSCCVRRWILADGRAPWLLPPRLAERLSSPPLPRPPVEMAGRKSFPLARARSSWARLQDAADSLRSSAAKIREN